MNFRDYMLAQIRQMEVDKWYEGERRGCDPSGSYIEEWIQQNGAAFREHWENHHHQQTTSDDNSPPV